MLVVIFFSNLICFSYRNTTNSLSISTKPEKNYLTVQELATGFFFSPSKLFLQTQRVCVGGLKRCSLVQSVLDIDLSS